MKSKILLAMKLCKLKMLEINNKNFIVTYLTNLTIWKIWEQKHVSEKLIMVFYYTVLMIWNMNTHDKNYHSNWILNYYFNYYYLVKGHMLFNMSELLDIFLKSNNSLMFSKSKCILADMEMTASLPKSSYTQGNGEQMVFNCRVQEIEKVVQLGFFKMLDTTNLNYYNSSTSFSFLSVAEDLHKMFKVKNVYQLLYSMDFFIMAYFNIMLEHKSLNYISLSIMMKFMSDFKTKQIHVKLNEKNNLLYNKIIHEMLCLILSMIYEKSLSNLNEGFNLNHNHKVVFNEVSYWNNPMWIMSKSTLNSFNFQLNHMFMKMLSIRIKDKYFLIVCRMYMSTVNKNNESFLLIFWKWDLFTIIFNIYLSTFDNYMKKMMGTFFMKLSYKSSFEEFFKDTQQLSMSVMMRSYVQNRIYYVRMTDKWMVGVSYNMKFMKVVSSLINSFFKIELEMMTNLSNTNNREILNVKMDKIYFLETEIIFFNQKMMMSDSNVTYFLKNGMFNYFITPVNSLMMELCKIGFLRPNGKIQAMTKWVHFTHYDILQNYNHVSKSLVKYYKKTNNFHSVISNLVIDHVLRQSCAKTLAQKFKLNRKTVFKKFGYDLKNYYNKSFYSVTVK
uniref:Reverse transcriptase protein n=1 Tax=Bryozoa sp. TaxID=2813608 RepID=A0AAU8L233_9BILA